MKKTAIALVVAGLATASVAQAAPQENTFYVGVKAGQASFHHDVRANAKENLYAYYRNSFTYGVFGGYQVLNRNNLGLALELGYDDFGRLKGRDRLGHGQKFAKYTNHGTHLSLKGSYEVLEGLDVYAKTGVALVRSDYKFYANGVKERNLGTHSLRPSVLFAAGVEYALLPELAIRLEYQGVTRVGKLRSSKSVQNSTRDYNPWIGSINAGISYRFGQGEAPVVAAPEMVSKTFSLNSDVTFAFGKANLKPQAQATLNSVYGEISQVKSAKVAVAGYTDRIGSDAFNVKLSQERADSVANYFVAKGVAADAISATGYGEANPVTGATCDQVKGRKALIACLAPDRRVEIAVNGTK
ncbi:TPA: porin OmpA [Haemophilus influenzae]|uniref:porin OmpA n=1 Tax=Haemophilus influenzae TaxID=727 RepID=UPI0001A3F5F3|nr:porin OmpA [Haemophilus influenzae]EEP47951.1 outer membrane protein P5 [Haemophilus influenzae 6P18H1]PRJ74051.1 Outer membrane protein P5 precursor [Haemophilus influenzae]PRK94669.1 Outer membrane protein P5 precursor [Haemophilus influenzae]PRK95086.1 Outer membrane protein P5 precursor [Haemophilus influenzae]PRL47558.1 Outer membrane protein P5 precursor [Haemophilus influenzae]